VPSSWCCFVAHPHPFNQQGTLTLECRNFLIGSVQNAVNATEATYGAQVKYAATSEVGLMAEVFGGTGSGGGVQAGARWSPNNGSFDVDLLVKETWNGGRARAVTIGLTMRR
jgi:hypothetical protein